MARPEINSGRSGRTSFASNARIAGAARAQAIHIAPYRAIAASDHPIDEAGDDPGAGHDFEMTPDDAIEAKCRGVEWHQPEITGKTYQPAADRVGQRTPDVKRFGDRDHEQRRKQGKPADEDEAEPEHDVQCALIDRT